MRNRFIDINADFKCIHCRQHISTNSALSGVINRNHCPYCLHSRHLDLYSAGDRLSACKGAMMPVGLTLKKTHKKYGNTQGELMLIHCCQECGKVSINRIAADDIAENIYEVFEKSLCMDQETKNYITESGILALQAADLEIVQARLFGGCAYPVYQSAVESFDAWVNIGG
jgi:hypothetical protein